MDGVSSSFRLDPFAVRVAALSVMSMHCNPIIFALNFLVSGHGVMVIYLSFIPTHPLVRNFSKKKKSNS